VIPLTSLQTAKRMTNATDAAPQQPPYRWAAFVFLGTLALYVATLAPTTQFWDTSEYIAAAKVLGIPHPPGNPLFTMMAHVWGMLPLAAAYAQRINLFAATTSAVAAACWFLVGERWMRPIVPTPFIRRLAALAGALVGATAFTVWNQSVVNEKVYTLSLLSIALILWIIVRWDDQEPGEAHDHHLLLIMYLLALTSTNHMMGVLVGPVVAVLLFPPLMTRRATNDAGRAMEWSQWLAFMAVFAILIGSGMEKAWYMVPGGVLYVLALVYAFYEGDWRFTLALLGTAAVGISVYFFLPLRSAHFPPINEGEPTTWHSLWAVLTRQQYGKPLLFDRQADIVAQMLLWVTYFRWQWGHDLAQNVQFMLAVVFGSLGVLGAWRHFKADRRQALAMMVLMGTLTVLLVFYLNFKYGYSQYLPRQLPREVRERDYFFVCSFALWGIWVGIGLATLMEWVQDGLRDRIDDEAKRWRFALPVLALALVPLACNRLTASRAHETLARDFAIDLLNSVEPYGILVTAGDNDTFPLWYAQEVEGVRRDVVIINLSLANTDWYLRQMQRRPVEEYDAARGPVIYRGQSWPRPTGRVLAFSPGQLDSLQLYYPFDRRQTFTFGAIQVALDPEQIHPLGNGQGYLEKADVVVLEAMRDQLGKRPIYFSRTVGTYADEFGLTPYLEGQGFARALRPQLIQASDSIVALPGFGWVNLARSKALAFDVYHSASAARLRPRGWVDRPSEGILVTYGLIYQVLAQAMQAKDPAGARRAVAIADSITKNSSDFRTALTPEVSQ
jgi:transmembrane protein TMEM260 (protein O-mannosyltransferase)